ncbi:uncharacterized protein CC84DRAFT_1223573 [Paraphaeosphaeria sporulosa]|uniref:Uncharacterized protein n=1 Tax=Paraphaeosphaeria sporulosa TaxID=1460663 RepID=A0A177BWF1_9PLEO|nr:uncharacterized protein CC84DRAFT_1223573 [Paraphaeosphaeria sporulosa]OAF98837.1 hypothetical protein CC84DRAFT_1223573 [Paraphaeosphaeria sporulosa]
MRLHVLTLLATLTAVLALPTEVLQAKPVSAKRDPITGLDPRQNYCFGFGNICFNDDDCKAVGCRGCISAPDVDPQHDICY